MKLDDDRPCSNCGRKDGEPRSVLFTTSADGYMPMGHITAFCCSFCCDEVQARMAKLYPEPDGIAWDIEHP